MIKLSYTNNEYKNAEFLRLIDRRVRKNAKGIIPDNQIIIEASSRNFNLAEYFLSKIFVDAEIINGKSKIKALSFEEEASIALSTIKKGEKPEKITNIFSRVTEEDICHCCKILKLEYKKPLIDDLLKNLLEKHPDMAFGFAQTLEKLK